MSVTFPPAPEGRTIAYDDCWRNGFASDNKPVIPDLIRDPAFLDRALKEAGSRIKSGMTKIQMPLPCSDDEAGFSLIEALVALLVLAIAAAGLVRAAEAHVDSIRSLERRAAAQLVAQNRLAELSLPDAPAGPATVDMLGQRWNVAVNESATEDADLAKIEVAVSGEGEKTPLVTLDGFRDRGTTTK